MTIDASSLIALLDRFGLPTVYLGVLGWLAWKTITGPLMLLAKAGVEYLQSATAALSRTLIDHVELKAHVTAESSATRAHVTAEVEKVRARVETAEDSIEGTVRSVSGQHLVVPSTATPRPAAPTLPDLDARREGP